VSRTTPPRTLGATTTLLGAILVALGCGNPETPLGAQGAASLATQRAPSTPVKFADGVISDAREQWRITFTPDGKTAYFASSADFFPFTRQATIYVSHLGKDGWSTPAVAPFSGRYSDIDPFLSPNGERLYFSSIRPIDGVMPVDIDLWYVERTADGWSEPAHLGPEVNSPLDELYPSADASGTLYFASGPFAPHAELHWDIYRAERRGDGFAPREGLAAINTAPVPGGGLQDAWEFNPEISANGKTLLFTSLRPGGHGLGDLYVSRLEGEEWSAPRNLGPLVNTASDEFHPTLSRDGRELYFVRRIPVRGDFYRIGTAALDLR
jgi:Tol biopolymer transport system component